MDKNNLLQSTLIGATIAVIFTTIITIVGELYTVTINGVLHYPIPDLLKNLHGHHWVGKGIWAVVIFLISSVTMYAIERNRTNEKYLERYVALLSYTIIAGTLSLCAFFVYTYFVH